MYFAGAGGCWKFPSIQVVCALYWTWEPRCTSDKCGSCCSCYKTWAQVQWGEHTRHCKIMQTTRIYFIFFEQTSPHNMKNKTSFTLQSGYHPTHSIKVNYIDGLKVIKKGIQEFYWTVFEKILKSNVIVFYMFCNLNRCPTNSTSHSLSIPSPWEVAWRFGMLFLVQKRKHDRCLNAWMQRANKLVNPEGFISPWWI